MTRNHRTHLWLTPGLAVLLVAAAGVLVVVYMRGVQHVRDTLTATAPTSTPTSAPPTATHSIAGTIRLQPGQYATDRQGCRGTTLPPDARVIVSDPAGTALTQAPLGTGKVTGGHCDLPFTLAIPAGAGTYGLDVPQVGQMTYTEQELADMLELTFG